MIRGSYHYFAEYLLTVAANGIFHNEKQPMRGILKMLFFKSTPVNYRNRQRNNNL